MRDCPQLEAAKRLLTQETSAKTDTKQNLSRTSAPSDSSAAFKKDGTAVVYEAEDSPVQIYDPALPMSEEATPNAKTSVVLRARGRSDPSNLDTGRLRFSQKSH